MSHDEQKKRILARRAKFVAAALAASGLGVAAACGGDVAPTGDGGTDAAADSPPQPCLSPPANDSGPQPCLGVSLEDAGDGGG
jgi:hypothetical protein